MPRSNRLAGELKSGTSSGFMALTDETDADQGEPAPACSGNCVCDSRISPPVRNCDEQRGNLLRARMARKSSMQSALRRQMSRPRNVSLGNAHPPDGRGLADGTRQDSGIE